MGVLVFAMLVLILWLVFVISDENHELECQWTACSSEKRICGNHSKIQPRCGVFLLFFFFFDFLLIFFNDFFFHLLC